MQKNAPIGVFDSGLGGISVLKQLKQMMPQEDFLYFGDSHFAPYGTKSKREIVDRCKEICDWMMTKRVKAIVIACNTATSAAVNILREIYPIPIIGMEPALKVAAHDKCDQTIVVMATPLTLKEKKFETLLSHYRTENHIIKIPCPELVNIVEDGKLKLADIVNKQLDTYYENMDTSALDSIVLGCTHFVFFRPYLEKKFPHVQIIDGNEGTCRHLYHILEAQDLLATQKNGTIQIYNSSSDPHYLTLSHALLED